MSSLVYFFRESLRGFTRNLSTTLGSIITIFLSLLIIGIFLVGGALVDRVVNSVESEVSITVYLADGASKSDVSALQSAIQGMEGVSTVSYTTKTQALERFKEMNAGSSIADQLGDENPLPASINVQLSDPKLVESVAEQIQANSLFKSVCDSPDNPDKSINYGQKTVERLFSVTNYIRYVGVALIGLLIFIAMVFINNTIRLAILARRKEIAIMRLVGASNGFIRGPFLMEGALHAVIGSLLAVGSIELVRQLLIPRFQAELPFLTIDVALATYLFVYLGLVVSGLVIGFIGSALAMRRYLKV
ncbi:ABC transporter permease [Eggerthellaceae bacterium zg-1084]|uniref:Cell division protein FtsX n=1 Tax=Berryella wangjianweii TaxID=2734634 RepID=A0A6M8J5E4_9ACTN|nr:permease-like cell division protein FtsX [Berryella wangjianweii]NPD31151.1 ABC transporter permease [Berryella wangjianweii]NPD32540.1 ABC transporter permease [Eggerthellaceae bacterium zg-997]QKF06709.1 ABC transporter permease [Berryella wangjianweii]